MPSMSGMLSPALRAKPAEAELGRLQTQARPVKRSTAIMVPNVRGRIDGWLDRLEDVLTHDTERGRTEPRSITHVV